MSGGKALALAVDVTSRAQVNEMVRAAIETFGGVQFQFNSAGAALARSKFLDIDDTLFERTFALNVKGTLHSVHYAAAKGAVVSMTLGVAREFAHAGIRCLSISPGPIRTPFQAAAQTSPELLQRFLDDVPMKRFGEPEEIGELVLFMCSDACDFMTGGAASQPPFSSL